GAEPDEGVPPPESPCPTCATDPTEGSAEGGLWGAGVPFVPVSSWGMGRFLGGLLRRIAARLSRPLSIDSHPSQTIRPLLLHSLPHWVPLQPGHAAFLARYARVPPRY